MIVVLPKGNSLDTASDHRIEMHYPAGLGVFQPFLAIDGAEFKKNRTFEVTGIFRADFDVSALQYQQALDNIVIGYGVAAPVKLLS